MTHPNTERNADIVRRVLSGESTQAAIARELGISKQRVNTIVKKAIADQKGKPFMYASIQ